MEQRLKLSSSAKWEEIVGYSRLIKVGNIIEVTGTVSLKDEKPYGENDVYAQTKRILEIISGYLEKAGSSLRDVVRTRIFVTDISKWEEVGKAHGEFFGEIKPVTSMVEVSALIQPEFMVEIEASAIASE